MGFQICFPPLIKTFSDISPVLFCGNHHTSRSRRNILSFRLFECPSYFNNSFTGCPQFSLITDNWGGRGIYFQIEPLGRGHMQMVVFVTTVMGIWEYQNALCLINGTNGAQERTWLIWVKNSYCKARRQSSCSELLSDYLYKHFCFLQEIINVESDPSVALIKFTDATMILDALPIWNLASLIT